MQRGYIQTVYFRHVTSLWLNLVILGFLYSQQILRHLKQAIQSPRGCTTYTVKAPNAGTYVTCPEQACVVPTHILARYHLSCVPYIWTSVRLLFQPWHLISLPASPRVSKINLYMEYASLGNRKPLELKGKMYTEIKNWHFFGTETWRHVMNIYYPS